MAEREKWLAARYLSFVQEHFTVHKSYIGVDCLDSIVCYIFSRIRLNFNFQADTSLSDQTNRQADKLK